MIGQIIAHYKILEKLGEGGMGVVYKAEDLKLKRIVALKFLRQEFTSDEMAKTRFVREAQAASALQHNNICTVHEIGEAPDKSLFICMDYYVGETIKEKAAGGPLPLRNAIDIIIQVAKGLAKAHETGVIHRDIKSANIVISEDGAVKILDFGLAKLIKRTSENTVSIADTLLGTVSYMSPEQVRGEKIDHRSDIWSLGILLYEMITGNLPFRGDYEQATIYSIINSDPEPMKDLQRNVADKLERIVRKALSKSLETRYQSVEDLISDLKAVEIILDSKLHPTASLNDVRRIHFRSLAAWVASIIFTVYLVFSVVGYLTREKIDESIPTLAVFPFENSQNSTNYEWLSEEFARTLTFRLGQLESLRVIDHFQVREAITKLPFSHAGTGPDAILDIAPVVPDVDLGMIGSYAIYGDSIRILTSLVNMKTRVFTPLVEETYSKSNLLGMQKAVAKKIVDHFETDSGNDIDND